ncbi:uncharacterized protein [Triticum aestivum]|uniref:uncharacterized protein n=1 Tax=Triticum aestivum TaxID=4565 RepID=UPI001D00A9BB|nr:uncharacterized protein LOC123137991 [Triticum aestivum]
MALTVDASAMGKFEFAYQDDSFCDKVLRLEVVAPRPAPKPAAANLDASLGPNSILPVSRKRARVEDASLDESSVTLYNKELEKEGITKQTGTDHDPDDSDLNVNNNENVDPNSILPVSRKRARVEDASLDESSVTLCNKELEKEGITKQTGTDHDPDDSDDNNENVDPIIIMTKDIKLKVSSILLASESIYFRKAFLKWHERICGSCCPSTII